MKGRINMSDLIVRPRMLKSGKTVYEYAFEIAIIYGNRKRKTKSGFRTKREAKEAGKIELSLYEKCGQTTKDTNISVADFFDLWIVFFFLFGRIRFSTQSPCDFSWR